MWQLWQTNAGAQGQVKMQDFCSKGKNFLFEVMLYTASSFLPQLLSQSIMVTFTCWAWFHSVRYRLTAGQATDFPGCLDAHSVSLVLKGHGLVGVTVGLRCCALQRLTSFQTSLLPPACHLYPQLMDDPCVS